MTSASAGRWADLLPRVLSAVAMILVGGVEIWLGGRFFHIFVGIVVALMMWELIRMIAPQNHRAGWVSACVSGAIVAVLPELGTIIGAIAMAMLSAVAGAAIGALASGNRRTGASYGLLIVLGGFTLILVRDNLGLPWILWLVLVVIASDVAGYFAGKSLGGPKFWPAISPKKTWSGTIAGWIAAMLVGAVFGFGSGIMTGMMILSVVIAFAAQMGDIAESAIKRRTGVKDSSRLIPGHGGVLDRFDGLLGAAATLFLIALFADFPKGLL